MLAGWWLALTICCPLQAGLLALTACFKLVVFAAGEAFSHNGTGLDMQATTCIAVFIYLGKYTASGIR
jgi:hypothetical protein